jgi:hypothetical protein
MDMTTTPVVASIVDQLGALKAHIASLRAQEEALKDLLADSGLAMVDGHQYRAAISRIDARPSIDWRAIAEQLNPPRQLVAAHTTWGEPFVTVRVSARKA